MKIFFDLDGPILDVSCRYYSIYSDLLREGGHSPLTKEEYWDYKRNRVPESEIINITCPASFIDSYISRRMQVIEDFNYLKLDRLHEGVREIFEKWSREHKLQIVTVRKRRDMLMKQLEYLDIKKYFTCIYSMDGSGGTWEVKYRMLKNEVNEPGECIIIGDTEIDIKAGKALCIKTAAVTCGIRTEELLARAKPDFIYDRINNIFIHEIENAFPIYLDYPINPQPRYGYGKPPHPLLYDIISRNRDKYADRLKSFLTLKAYFFNIPVCETTTPQEPCWINSWLGAFDSVSLYSFITIHKPRRYFEIGSGYSTRFAKRAIEDHDLPTEIASIDPYPRVEIDEICDTIIRKPLEDIDLSIFDRLEAGDILFIDGTHRCFMNSDATVFFLDILPKLKVDVIVGIHDIQLPYDYLPIHKYRYYSEQYLLAAYILSCGSKFDILLANEFISQDNELSQILNVLWEYGSMKRIKEQNMARGSSFWVRMN
jgi:phosphoglycolate phosphatase-like HAD superfamily hydrolase